MIVTFNVDASSSLSHMGANQSTFRPQLKEDVTSLCAWGHVVGLQELNEHHVEWLPTNLSPDWRMAGDVLWDTNS